MRSKYSHDENIKQSPEYNYLFLQAVPVNDRSRYIPGIFIMERKEIWKDIEGYEGLYQVSNLGRVKSFLKYKGTKKRILKSRKYTNGYLFVNLYKNGKSYNKSIHRLVAIAFMPNPKNKSQVNHINGVKTDNQIKNLEWCTHSENMNHGYKNGLINNSGENHPNHKLTQIDVNAIRRKYKYLNKTQTELAEEYNIIHQQISDIINYKQWKYI